MMNMFKKYLTTKQKMFEQALRKETRQWKGPYRLKQAMQYALFTGGKRIRPILVLMTAELLHVPLQEILPIAIALECIHTYSLIHDDLPSMDDDDYRRGKLTVHKQYDEATAILTGDALLTYAFSVLVQLPKKQYIPNVLECLSEAAGEQGMVGGQLEDIILKKSNATAHMIKKIHQMKTGALFHASIMSVVVYSGIQNKRLLKEYADFAHAIGYLFQLTDDKLDVEEARNGAKNSLSNLALIKGSTYVDNEIQKCQNITRAFLKAHASNNAVFPALIHYLATRAQ